MTIYRYFRLMRRIGYSRGESVIETFFAWLWRKVTLW